MAIFAPRTNDEECSSAGQQTWGEGQKWTMQSAQRAGGRGLIHVLQFGFHCASPSPPLAHFYSRPSFRLSILLLSMSSRRQRRRGEMRRRRRKEEKTAQRGRPLEKREAARTKETPRSLSFSGCPFSRVPLPTTRGGGRETAVAGKQKHASL